MGFKGSNIDPEIIRSVVRLLFDPDIPISAIATRTGLSAQCIRNISKRFNIRNFPVDALKSNITKVDGNPDA